MLSKTTRTGETIARTLLAIKPTGAITLPEINAISHEFGCTPTELVAELRKINSSLIL